MRRFILLNAILILFYLKNTISYWKIKVNNQNVISETFLTEMGSFSSLFLNFVFYLIILICIVSLFFRGNYFINISTYIMSMTILSLGYYVAIDMLSYKEISNFLLFEIHHPIPLEAKKQYLLQQLSLLFTNNSTNITPELLELFQRNIKAHFENMNWNVINSMNPVKIKDYALTLLTTTPHEHLTDKQQFSDFLYNVIFIKDTAALTGLFLLIAYIPNDMQQYICIGLAVIGFIDSIITYIK